MRSFANWGLWVYPVFLCVWVWRIVDLKQVVVGRFFPGDKATMARLMVDSTLESFACSSPGLEYTA